MEKKITNNRISYVKEIPAEKAGEMKRLVSVAALVVGRELADGMRMHGDAERMQSSTYWEVSDDDGGVYSVCIKAVKLSQAERMTRTRATSISAGEFATWLVSLASSPAAMTAAATKAVQLQTAYADYLLTPVPAGESRKSSQAFFADMLKKG